ncbi:MAG TPA: hypothetical protein PLF81_24615 [Candidatus Anammoximicrobium sp.]|nr:hypothetical protein [Candidatus Anammoximicrobium sp.]
MGMPMDALYGLVMADREKRQAFANLHFTPAGSQLMGQHIAARILEFLSQWPCLEEQEAHAAKKTPAPFFRCPLFPVQPSRGTVPARPASAGYWRSGPDPPTAQQMHGLRVMPVLFVSFVA